MFPFFNHPGAVRLRRGLKVKREGLEIMSVYVLDLGIFATWASR
jgi:hypothetical protein